MDAGAPARQSTPHREHIAQLTLAAILVLVLPLALASSPKIFNDGDVSWHIATGEWILNHRTIPTADPFSYTAAGQPWVVTEWLADAIFAALAGMPRRGETTRSSGRGPSGRGDV